MEYFPIFLKVKQKKCLVVGGGIVAYRKAQTLLKAGAHLTVIAKTYTVDFSLLKRKYPNLKFQEAEINENLLSAFCVIVAATDDNKLNQYISETAQTYNIPVNVVDDPQKCSFIQPAIVNRSPILVAISSGGTAPVLAKRIREKIEALLPTKIGLVAKAAGKLRAKVQHSNYPNKRLFWEKLFDGLYGHFICNNNHQKAAELVDNLLTQKDNETGFVYLTGAGPGNPELLTIKALNTLQRCDVILYDQLVSAEILDMARRDATLVPVGKSAGKASTPQTRINELMVKYAKQGKLVCRLKGGDPFIYGRGGEEIEHLRTNKIAYEIIPGITAASGCAAAAGIPLTHRTVADSVTFVTAKLKGDKNINLIPLARKNHTLVIYMGLSSASKIQEQLLNAGYDTHLPIAIIEKGTTVKQRIVTGTLSQLNTLIFENQISSPAIIYVGQTAAFANDNQEKQRRMPYELFSSKTFMEKTQKIHHLSA